MRLPTASELPRVLLCNASAVMPRVNSTSGAAERGSVIHRFCHSARKAGRKVALEQIEDKDLRRFCEAIDLTKLPTRGEPEITFAYDYKTDKGRVLGSALDRDYNAARVTEYVGTADDAERIGKRGKVGDIKTGFVRVQPDSWQMKGLALFLARTYGLDEVESTIYQIDQDANVWPSSVVFTAMDLDSFAMTLQALPKKLERLHGLELDEMDVTEGECRYCPALTRCPAKVGLVKAIAGDLSKLDPSLGMTKEQLGVVYERIHTWLPLIARMESAIEEAAKQEPIPLPSGGVLREVEKTRESIDAEMAFTIIARDYGFDVADLAIEKKATKAGLKRTLNGKHKAALEAIDVAGGIIRKTSTAVEVVDE